MYGDPRFSLGLIIVIGTIALVFYFIPSFVAFSRGHPHLLAIFIVNLLFGAIGVGWIGALIWALITPHSVAFAIPVRAYDDSDRAFARNTIHHPPAMRTEPFLVAAVKTCPSCGEEVRPAATRCRFCGHGFDEQTHLKPSRVAPRLL